MENPRFHLYVYGAPTCGESWWLYLSLWTELCFNDYNYH